MKTFFAKFSSRSYFLLSLFIITTHQLIYQPYIGPTISNYSDFAMFMEHWLVGKIWFNKNFLQVPWFTPAHCMAFPFYANPQNLYFSFSQLFFILFSPEFALRFYFLFLSLIAYFGTFLFLSKSLKLNKFISILGATLFLINGFFNERFLVAHYGTVTYVFLPFCLFFLCESLKFNFKDKKYYLFIILTGFTFSQIVYGGSAALTLPIFYSVFITILCLILLKFDNKLILNFFISFLVFIFLSASKVISSIFLLQQYPRNYLEPIVSDNIFFILKTIFTNLFFFSSQYGAANYFSSQLFSHELNYFVSVVPLLIIVLFFFKRKNLFSIGAFKENIFLSLFILILFIMPLIINHHNGFVNLFLNVPIIKDLWINTRFFLIYQIPLIVLSCVLLNKLDFKWKNELSIFLICLSLFQVYFYPKERHHRIEFYVQNEEMIKKISKKDYSIKNVFFVVKENDYLGKFKNNEYITDGKDFLHLYLDTQLINHGTLFDCYEPILGYDHEQRSRRTKIIWPTNANIKNVKNIEVIKSNPFWTYDGLLNFNNPICQIFPNENNCKKGDNFHIKEKQKLANLLNFKPIKFNKSFLQIFSDYLTLVTLITIFLFYIFMLIKKINLTIKNTRQNKEIN